MSPQSKKEPKGKPVKSSKQPENKPGGMPFEPAQNRKKSVKKETPAPEPRSKVPPVASPPRQASHAAAPPSSTTVPDSATMPEVVSRRMVRRVALFSGLPTALGMLTFIISYFIVKQHWFPLPNLAVVLVSMGCFGLGVLGLSYGALSASWDEERSGSWHGVGEFSNNFSRLVTSWRSLRQKDSAQSSD